MKMFNVGFFRGAEGAAKFFDPLSTKYFGIFFSLRGGGRAGDQGGEGGGGGGKRLLPPPM